MATLQHQTTSDNPCPCPACLDSDARDRAAHLDMATDAAAADAIRWGLFSPDLPRTYRDEDNPDRLARDWEPPSGEDAAWWEAESFYEGCGPDELSPEEQEIELYGEAEWVAACKEHDRWMEEREQEAAYHEMIGRLTLGGHPSDC